MTAESKHNARELEAEPALREAAIGEETEGLGDNVRLRDRIKGHTTEHPTPPRLEDEGQPGG
jgi:hypothetical protein